MKALFAAVVASALAFCTPAFAGHKDKMETFRFGRVSITSLCAAPNLLRHHLEGDFKLAPVMVAIEYTGNLTEVYAGADGKYAIVTTATDNAISCVVSTGTDFDWQVHPSEGKDALKPPEGPGV